MSTPAALLTVITALFPGDSIGHPLDPLTGSEISITREVLAAAGKLTGGIRFATLELWEPDKATVRQQLLSKPFRRSAEAVLFDWARSTGFRARVDLISRRLTAWDSLPSREPPSRSLIRARMEEIVHADPRWGALLRQLGIADSSRIRILPVLGESQAIPWRDGDRVVRGFSFDTEAIDSASRVGSLQVEVNLTRGTLLGFRHSGGQTASAPSLQTFPAGRSKGTIELQGNALAWKSWRLRFGVHPRRGLELWDVGWMDSPRIRPILYRASVSEVMAVYGDPQFQIWYPRDAGNAGLGTYQRNSAIELEDAPAGASYADAVFADELGRPFVVPRMVAVYERDGGLLWRHAGRARRGRQLVLSSHTTIDNYDFTFNWIFGEDGALEVQVELTGMLLLRPDQAPSAAFSTGHGSYAHQVAPGIFAPNHQHFFSYRLDFDVDGSAPNRVVELEGERVPQGRFNQPGLWFGMTERVLRNESEAQRNLHTAASRRWRVINPGQRNSLGEPVGYTLVPGEVAIPLATPRSPARRSAGFVGAQLWVTPYRRDELYAAGEFVNFSWLDQGLPSWTRSRRSVSDTDVVLWYTLGVTHLPRPEDYPVMPVYRASFRLVPTAFFGGSPTAGR